ncbi:MAG: GTP cyclohydrolase II [Lentisphaeria bacterium]|jgi:GTP cyclohydrolase II|nr:GTP cyclohydrolase II [Lentisphaeria bacterium]
MATPLDSMISTDALQFAGQVKMPSRYSDQDFDLHCFVDTCESEHVALVYGDVAGAKDVLTRVHSECLTGDVFHSARCDCGDQLDKAMRAIVAAGTGLLIYLRQEGRGIGLINKIRAYRLQDRGLDTVDANETLGFPPDSRVYTAAAQIIDALQVHSIRLLTNNPEKMNGLTNCGVNIAERVPLIIPAEADNEFYLRTKRDRLGHLL